MSYDPLFSLPTGTDDIESVFKTARGSTYAHHADTTSTRNRSGANHSDKSTGIQQRSGRTIYMSPDAVNSMAGLYQNAEMATKFIPVLEDGKPTGRVALQLTEDYGPKKAGTILATAPYKTKPLVGMNPVEIYGSESPLGSSGRNIHFGNAITEVYPKPDRLKGAAGKAGVAAALMGAASAAKAGQYGQALDKVTDLAVLPFAESRGLNENEAAELAKRRAMPPTIDKARGGSIKMPDEYSRGSWKLI
jgi:hypothetical protein